MDFSGKSVIVTGASMGVGKATAIKFASLGADVAIADVKEEELEKVKEEVAAYGHRVLSYICDVSDEARVREVASSVLHEFGKADVLVNNAGVWRRWKPFLETDSTMWKSYIGVNILGTMYFTHAILPSMLENGSGSIINLGSVAGVYGNANMADYSATKGAVISFTKAIAKEVAAKGVRVNSVSPGTCADQYDTPKANPNMCYMERSGAHTEYANMIAFLASDEASYISGQDIQVDGCRKHI